MKKIIFLLTNVIFAIITISNTVIAQKNDIAFNAPAHINGFLPFVIMGFAEMKANDVNIKAVRNFVKTFKTVSNNKWFAAEDGFYINL